MEKDKGIHKLLSNTNRKKDADNKPKSTSKKIYKSYYLNEDTIALINKVTIMTKLEKTKYNVDDAMRDAFELFAKENGIAVK